MGMYDDNGSQAPKGARLVFGILMIFVYMGVGLLFIFNMIPIIDAGVLNYIIGGLLCAYGIWRAIRLFKGWN